MGSKHVITANINKLSRKMVKGKTKTRISKSTKKGPKLKWWYILPVIAIVAVAGYAIVRYSQAAIEIKPAFPKDFTGGIATQNKNNIPVRVIGGKPVRIKYGSAPKDKNSFFLGNYNGLYMQNFPDLRGKYVCVEAWVGAYNNGPAAWSVNIKANTGGSTPFGTKYQTIGESNKVYYKQNAWDRQCVRLIQNTPFTVYQADITIINGFPGNTKDQPFVGVSKVWYQDSL